MRISLVTTLYKNAPHIEELYDRTVKAIKKITDDYEIVFVNDGSPDGAYEIAKSIALRDPSVTFIDLSRNFGQHPALMTGIGASTGDYVFICDGDLEEQPEWIGQFYEHMKEHGGDVVYGVQATKKGSLFYRLARRIFYKILNLVSGVNFPENITTARLMTRRYVNVMLQFKERALFAAGIWHMAGFRQLPLRVAKSDQSATTYDLRRLISLFVNAVTAFSTRPLQAISLAGIVISFIAGLFIAYLVYRKLFFGDALAGWTSVMATLLLLGGLIQFFNGIIAIYIAKIFIEVKQRPLTSIREIIGGKRAQRSDCRDGATSPRQLAEPPADDYHSIVRHYESCLAEHREGARAVDWKDEESARIRYDVMLDLLAHERETVSLLDFGCGLGSLKQHIDKRGLRHIHYEGLDISPAYAEAALKKMPGVTIHCFDVLKDDTRLRQYDYIVMNGIFTRKENMSHQAMLNYLQELTTKLFRHARRGIAFNAMSPYVDWKANELFHPGFDELASVISSSLSRHMVLRNDYGLYETTSYVYREPRVRKVSLEQAEKS